MINWLVKVRGIEALAKVINAVTHDYHNAGMRRIPGCRYECESHSFWFSDRLMDNAGKLLQRLTLAMVLSMVASWAHADLLDALQAYREGNYLLAFDEFRTLALNGDADAQFRLGDMYAKGEGVTQDFKQAFDWFLKAASHDEPRAQLAVAEAYEQGHGVTQDSKRAATWYLMAAEHGNPRAEYAIGLMYAKGTDMPLDLVEARKWLGLAGDIAAGSKVWVEGKMTTSQIEKAKELEMEWRERYK